MYVLATYELAELNIFFGEQDEFMLLLLMRFCIASAAALRMLVLMPSWVRALACIPALPIDPPRRCPPDRADIGADTPAHRPTARAKLPMPAATPPEMPCART